MAAPPPPPPPPPPDPQLQPVAEGSAASKLSRLEHHPHGAGDEPSFRMEDLPALQKVAPGARGMFMHLRHLTCGLTVLSLNKPNSDNGVLQLVHCLNVAPQLKTLHLDMIYSYFKASAPDEVAEEEGPHMHRHDHLKTVHISGFRCYKAQAELACCILENARVLEHMEVQPRVAAAICGYADLKNFTVERRFLPGVREWARLASERFGKAITVLDAPSE